MGRVCFLGPTFDSCNAHSINDVVGQPKRYPLWHSKVFSLSMFVRNVEQTPTDRTLYPFEETIKVDMNCVTINSVQEDILSMAVPKTNHWSALLYTRGPCH